MVGSETKWGHTDWSLTANATHRWIGSDMPDAGQKAAKLWSQLRHKTVGSVQRKAERGDSNPLSITLYQ